MTPQITCLTGLVMEAQKRETGGIRSEEISEGGSGGSGQDPGILRFRVFHLNSRVLTFC